MTLKLPEILAGPNGANAVRGERGFTLIEILITIAILGVLGTMAYMGMDTLHRHRLTAATMELYADMQKLRQDAMTRSNVDNSLGFGIRVVNDSSYVLFEFEDCSGNFAYTVNGCDGGREEFQPVTRNLPQGVTMVLRSTGNPPDNDVRLFDKKGMVRLGNWGTSNNGLTLLLRHPDVSQRRCVVLSTARIREGLWNESTSSCN